MTARAQIIRDLLGRRIHIQVDRPIGYLHGDIRYPVNYGYIPGLFAGDGEEQDAYILGISVALTEFDGVVIAAAVRRDDCEDKLIVVPEGMTFTRTQIAAAVSFQEQYFSSVIVVSPGEMPDDI